jgi:hypothetical protein
MTCEHVTDDDWWTFVIVMLMLAILYPLMKSFKWFAYAVAACVAVMAGLGFGYYLGMWLTT